MTKKKSDQGLLTNRLFIKSSTDLLTKHLIGKFANCATDISKAWWYSQCKF